MAKRVVTILGWVFIVIGLLGFFNNPILGIFPVNGLHNIIHLLTGVLALVAASKGEEASVMFSKIFGVVYALVTVLGFLTPGFINGLLNGASTADNLLHLVLAVVFLYAGYGPGSKMQSNNMQM